MTPGPVAQALAGSNQHRTITTQQKKPRITARNSRKPNKDLTGQQAEFVSKRVVLGRRPKNNFKQLSKFVRNNISQTVYGGHFTNKFGGVSGNLILPHQQTTTGTTLLAPLNVFDLTSVMNPNAANVVQTPNTSKILNFSDETAGGLASWNDSGKNLTLEGSPNATTLVQNYPGPGSVLKWAQMKLLFYAPTALPCKISVRIVQFTDLDLCPDTTTAVKQTLNARASSWFQAFMKRSMYSPIETNEAGGFKGIKVLHSQTFILNPKATTDGTLTLYKQLDIFKWFNRKCTYDWNQIAGTSPISNVPAVEAGQNSTTVHPKARIFLMIQAQSGYKLGAGSFDSTIHPSYDMVLRTAHEQMSA